jgi:hypothetical protein
MAAEAGGFGRGEHRVPAERSPEWQILASSPGPVIYLVSGSARREDNPAVEVRVRSRVLWMRAQPGRLPALKSDMTRFSGIPI